MLGLDLSKQGGGLSPTAADARAVPRLATAREGERAAVQVGPVWWVLGLFLVAQVSILVLAPTGPFVDEGLYVVAGLRVLEGKGPADGYLGWFNGSPFLWPVLAAAGHRVSGLAGARLMAVVCSAITLVAVASAAGRFLGPRAAGWCALALALNGLFAALAHFAVYDVLALACLAVSIWCVSRSAEAHAVPWITAAAVAFATSVIAKYGYVVMVIPVLGLLLAARERRTGARGILLFSSVAGGIVAAYFLACFGTVFPPSSAAYLDQPFGRTRGHIATLQLVFGLAPSILAIAAVPSARRRPGGAILGAACLLALLVYPAFHLWTANFVSGQKHVVGGFLFASMLAGVTLERLWRARPRALAVAVLAGLAVWGGVQCSWQDRSWHDARPLAQHLATHIRPGDRVLAESAWTYALYLYPAGLIPSPAAVIDANHSPERHRVDPCEVAWIVGNPRTAPDVQQAVERCGHQPVLSTRTPQYYFDTSRLMLTVTTTEVSLYSLPRPE